MHVTDAKMQKIEPDPIFFFLWRTKVLETYVKSFLFFNMQKFWTPYAMTLRVITVSGFLLNNYTV